MDPDKILNSTSEELYEHLKLDKYEVDRRKRKQKQIKKMKKKRETRHAQRGDR